MCVLHAVSLCERATAADLLQQVENCVRLLGLESDYAPAELLVDKEGFLTRDGVTSDEGMRVLDRLSLDDTTSVACSAELGLSHTRVHDRKGLEILSERRRQSVVGLCSCSETIGLD